MTYFFERLFPDGMNGEKGLNALIDLLFEPISKLTVFLVIIWVCIQVLTYFANPNKDMDPYILVRPILIMAAIFFYKDLVYMLLQQPTDFLTEIIEEGGREIVEVDTTQNFDRYFMAHLVATDFIKEGVSHIISGNPIIEFLHIILSLALLAASFYIMIRQVLSIALYHIIGIIALPLSLIPGNQEILKKWFFGFLSVLLWMPILRILQTIILTINAQEYEGENRFIPTDDGLVWLALQVGMLFFILATPKYANMLVSGSGDSDSSGYLFAFFRETYYRSKNNSYGSIASQRNPNK